MAKKTRELKVKEKRARKLEKKYAAAAERNAAANGDPAAQLAKELGGPPSG
jgi:hypothetical protein